MFAYCNNNPINRFDPSGCSWLSDIWNSIKNGAKKAVNFGTALFDDLFGAAIVKPQVHKSISLDTIIHGTETGTSMTGVVCGDLDHPVSFFMEKPNKLVNLYEYQFGIQINFKNGSGASFTRGILERSVTVSDGNKAFTGIIGNNKVGYTISYNVDFVNNTATSYYHEYFRTIPTATVAVIAVALTYFTGGTIWNVLSSFNSYTTIPNI